MLCHSRIFRKLKLNLTVFFFPPAGRFPDAFEALEDVLEDDEGRGQAGPLVVLGHQPIHLPLPHVLRIFVDFFKDGSAFNK